MEIIRKCEKKDWDHLWKIIEPVFRAGETYSFSPEITEEDAYYNWIKKPKQTYVAVNENNQILATYYIKTNQEELGSHVCNCGYIVSENARGKGLADKLCKHSQEEAVNFGFKSMQYNLVVSTNEPAVHLWQKNGFYIVGTLPKAFNHKKLGLVDAFVMYKHL